MQKIITHLWFEDQAEEAASFYTGLFENARITRVTLYPEAAESVSGKKAGSVMTVDFELDGQRFVALNGGKVPGFEFSPAMSLAIMCDTQEEIDRLWNALSARPEAEQCGWLIDKYGVSWQIVPTVLEELLNDADTAKVERVSKALLQMKKLDIAALRAAASQ